MRIVMASMNDIGRYSIEELAKHPEVELVGLFTVQERGGLYMDPTDYSQLAEKYGLEVVRISNINSAETEKRMRQMQPDLCMCIGWKQIIKKSVLSIPKFGWIGCHPTKLLLKGEKANPDTLSAPGNEPLNHAILGGFKKTGTSLQWLKLKIDTGELLARAEVDIDQHETAASLVEKMGRITGRLISENLQSILDGNPPRMIQEHQGLMPFMQPIVADDNCIDPAAPAEETYRLIRACVYPYPNAFFEFYGSRIYVESARLQDGKFIDMKLRFGGSPYAK
jgi:methionyl-tRNA formyltransferase